MDVVQAENERAGRRETLEEIAQRAVRAVPVTWRRRVREAVSAGSTPPSAPPSARPRRDSLRSPAAARCASSASVHSA